MTSYRFKRRAFLGGVGGAVGLKVMLRTLEAAAQTTKSPARLLVTHWPVGACQTGWAPTSGSVAGSAILKPFADAGLGADMTTFRGLTTNQLASPGGGGHEAGTVKLVTGVACPGTRSGEPEQDDAYSGGPSVDQIFLKNVAALKPPGGGAGYANSICDSRVDVTEISTQCLSYSYSTSSVNSVQNGASTQNTPLLPVLSPLQQWNNLFSNFIPGSSTSGGGPTTGATTGNTTGNTTGGRTTGNTTGGRTTGNTTAAGTTGPYLANAALKQAVNRKSVLDFAINELAELRKMAPASARDNIDIHTAAIQKVESQLAMSISGTAPPGTTGGTSSGTTGRAGTTGTTGRAGTTGGMTTTGGATTGATTGVGGSGTNGGCTTKPAQPTGTGAMGGSSGSPGTQYSPSVDGAKTDDSVLHAAVGKLHTEIFKAAFICDLLRVGTFQWSPGTNHVGFKGMMPGEATTLYQHHPVSHRIGHGECIVNPLGNIAQFLVNIHIWYNQQHAAIFADWKKTIDGLGNSLLDYTVVPYVTEVQDTGHGWTDMSAAIIGGKALGYTHNIYKTGSSPITAFWGTVGQAFGYSGMGPIGTPIAGLWTKPA